MKDPTFASLPWSGNIAVRVRIEESQPYAFPLPTFPTEPGLDAKAIREPVPSIATRPIATRASPSRSSVAKPPATPKPTSEPTVLHRSTDHHDSLSSLLDTDAVVLLTTPVLIPAHQPATKNPQPPPPTPNKKPKPSSSSSSKSQPNTQKSSVQSPSDPFEPLGQALAHHHSRIRHVPYLPTQPPTRLHESFLSRCRGVVVVVCEPQQQTKTTSSISSSGSKANGLESVKSEEEDATPVPDPLEAQLRFAREIAAVAGRFGDVPSVLVCFESGKGGEGGNALGGFCDGLVEAFEGTFGLVVHANSYDAGQGALEGLAGLLFQTG